MEKISHPKYKDYAEHPYISPERDLALWEISPELFPYKAVEKKQMLRLPEGVLPGDIVMLWRIHFGTFTNEVSIPQYFEYRYGVDSDESLQTLLKLRYARLASARESLTSLSVPIYKKILQQSKLDIKGKKDDLVDRILYNFTEEKLAKLFTLRSYLIAPAGETLLQKYDDIIQKHGRKM